ncbi:hypothetical protein [Lactococcus taiwanensis]|uniref:hypothetical protein n=1 Tax=Lactococcus taiwanensis TaxID=1151742 RepID=UPI00289E0466|nr:hypothetical protein [Lactococcus taiwanensis]
MNKNDKKLFVLANDLLGDVANQKITGISVNNTNYGDGSKRLSIDIDYVEKSDINFKIKTDGLKNITVDDIFGDIIKAGKLDARN